MNVAFELPTSLKPAIVSTWSHFLRHFNNPADANTTEIKIGLNPDCQIVVSQKFYSALSRGAFNPTEILDDAGFIKNGNGSIDHLGSAFYLMNCLEEYHASPDSRDPFGRFKSSASIQNKFQLSCENHVEKLFGRLIHENPILSDIGKANAPSQIFLSHDVDMINSALFQEGKAAIKALNIPQLLSLIFKYFISGPSYRDMDRIMDIHDAFDVKSTFFWLVEQGSRRASKYGATVPQADYNVKSQKIRKELEGIIRRGFTNGLHKSTIDQPYDLEVQKIDQAVISNRNHYLQYQLPEHFNLIEDSCIDLDFSLGFGPQFGFRNNYGRPFIPFNVKENKPYNFLEVPLQIMDTTFKYYQKKSPLQAKKEIITFLDRNHKNCTISILWHNDMFSPIKNPGWLKIYKEILDFCRQEKIKSTTQKELLTIRDNLLTSYHNNS